MRAALIIFLLELFLSSAVLAQNNLPATPNPRNLGDAAGLYAGAVAQLQAVKSSSCGYAVTRPIPTVLQAIRTDIAPRFSPQQRGEVINVLGDMAPSMLRQGENTLAATYNHYTQQEKLDHNTACGFVAAMAISVRKLAYEAMVKKSSEPDWERGVITPPAR